MMKKLLCLMIIVIALSSCSKKVEKATAPATNEVVTQSPSLEPSISPSVEPSPTQSVAPSPKLSEKEQREHEAVQKLNKAFDESNLRLAIAKEKIEEEYKRDQICDTQQEMYEQYGRAMSKECIQRVTKQGHPPVDRRKEAEESLKSLPPLQTFHK